MILLLEEREKKGEGKERRETQKEDFIVGGDQELRKGYVVTPLPPKDSMPKPQRPEKKPKNEED